MYFFMPPHKLVYPLHSAWLSKMPLPAGFATRPYRSTDATVLVGVEGEGTLQVADRRFEIGPHDVAVVPGWTSYTLSAGGADWALFSYSDRVAQEKLGFWRDERL